MAQNYPQYISSKPVGEDKFEGNAHHKLAEIIAKTIQEESLEKKIIGLEGEWGSGKSNLIEIVQKNLGQEYHTFIFDAWGSQEDLTRKSFLEQLIGDLFNQGFLKDSAKWKDLKSKLLSKTSTTQTQKFPQIKSYWLLMTLGVIFFTVLMSVYNTILEHYDLFPNIYFGFWKPILSIYFLPLVLIGWGLLLARNEYLKQRAENAEKESLDKETKWETLGKMFYWFNGNEINSEELEYVIEDEPSVKQFREYFKNIEDELKSTGRLILVFDNLDRLETDKLRSLWSSIHTFFAEDLNPVNSWVIIPFDKVKLKEHLQDGYDGFVSKTFTINFRITPPVVTEWESFLTEKIVEAFGTLPIDQEEKEYLVKLFDVLSSHEPIRPRQIINYVNDVVSLYKQWHKEIESGDLRLRYISLFLLTKNKILENPGKTIIERTYLGQANIIFDRDPDLDTSISMIVFGVGKKLADEVLLDRQLKLAIRSGDDKKILSLSTHRAFGSYFLKANQSIPIGNKIGGLAKIYSSLNGVLSESSMRIYWEKFAAEISSVEGQWKSLNNNHKVLILNTDNSLGKKILRELVQNLRNNISSSDDQEIYFQQLMQIRAFLNEEKKDLDIFSMVTQIYFDAGPYLKFIKAANEDFRKYKISCTEENFESFFLAEDGGLNTDMLNEWLDQINLLREEFNFNEITKKLISRIGSVSYIKKEDLRKYLKILGVIRNKSHNLTLSTGFYSQLSSALMNQDKIYEDAVCIAISDFKNAYNNSSSFQNFLKVMTEEQILKIAPKMKIYFGYNNFLELIVSNTTANSLPKLKKVLNEITRKHNYSETLDINWALKNYNVLIERIFNNNTLEVEFLENLDRWQMFYKTGVKSIPSEFFKNLELQHLNLIKKITEECLTYLDSLSKKEILEAIRTGNKDFEIIKQVVENDLIGKFSGEFHSAYDDYIKSVAKGEIALPDDIEFWDELMNKLDGRKMISTFTSVRDILINEKGEVNEDELYFFEKGLILYGNLHKKPNESTLKVIIPMIESDRCFDLFLKKQDKLCPIINNSSEHKDTALNEIELRLRSEKYNGNIKLEQIAKFYNLKAEKEII